MLGTRLGAGLVLVLAVVVATPLSAAPVLAASAAEINRDVDAALARLVADVPSARTLAQKAKAVLVFPTIVKAGFMFGAQYGDGALRRQGKTVGYYNTVAASYGLQAGVQSFGYALLFMNDAALAQLNKTGEGRQLRPRALRDRKRCADPFVQHVNVVPHLREPARDNRRAHELGIEHDTRALRTPTYWSVAWTNCPPGVCCAPGDRAARRTPRGCAHRRERRCGA